MKIFFCAKCVYPSTKPDLTFDDKGVCSACLAYEERKNIDWAKREREFKILVSNTTYKDPDRPYDCIIPVSGGKDSHFQVLAAIKYGLRPLAVTAETDHLSTLGRANLDNIGNLGVDHVTVSINRQLRRNLARYTLETIGDISWAEHATIFTIPIREAIQRNIPLVIWGENPQNEYGGPTKATRNTMALNSSWLHEFGGLNGLRVSDIIDAGIAQPHEMYQFITPSKDQWPKSAFLGQYFPWNGLTNANVAKEHGFKWADEPVSGTGIPYENLDNYQTGIHDYFKWLKFGFGRATDIACNYIRRDYMSREQGIKFVKRHDGEFPNYYLKKSLSEVLDNIGMSIEQFMTICDKFTNPQLFEPRVEPLTMPVPRFKLE